jgi:4-amino-4-deoxy-L-arabinose transferase-like glycosyltransferase
MNTTRTWRSIVFSDLGILILLALVRLALNSLTNGQYGWHRDELATLDDARYLAWGYVAYPPVTPFIARVALEMFGPSLVGVRFFCALAMAIAMVLTGLMARELGGRRFAQVVAAVAAAIAPAALSEGNFFQYVSFDYLWWVLAAYLMIRLLKSQDPRWWLGIGAVIGLGMLTKYTMAFFTAGIVVAVILTSNRRYLTSPWLWRGVALAVLIFLPNLVWQVQHNFVSLTFLDTIHARDVAIGRTKDFLIEQFYSAANLFTLPLWVAGLYFYLFAPAGKRYRSLGWMFVVPFGLFLIAQGRGNYMPPAYPMLFAAGAVLEEQWLAGLTFAKTRLIRGVTWSALILGGIVMAPFTLPIAPLGSDLYAITSSVNDGFKESVGWPELVETVAGIYATLPATDRSQAGILTGNYGEAGAINLYGPAYGLPQAISGINSYWLRGYGDPPPQTLIVLGLSQGDAMRIFDSCTSAGQVANRYNVENEETREHPVILVCRGPRAPWPELWKRFQWFG